MVEKRKHVHAYIHTHTCACTRRHAHTHTHTPPPDVLRAALGLLGLPAFLATPGPQTSGLEARSKSPQPTPRPDPRAPEWNHLCPCPGQRAFFQFAQRQGAQDTQGISPCCGHPCRLPESPEFPLCLTPGHAGCVALGKSLRLSGPPCLHLRSGEENTCRGNRVRIPRGHTRETRTSAAVPLPLQTLEPSDHCHEDPWHLQRRPRMAVLNV